MKHTLNDIFSNASNQKPNKPFIVFGDKILTYSELICHVRKFTTYFIQNKTYERVIFMAICCSAVACCRDYNAENRMGNVKESTLEEIWNGEKYVTFRQNMVKGYYKNAICEPCMNIYYTEK